MSSTKGLGVRIRGRKGEEKNQQETINLRYRKMKFDLVSQIGVSKVEKKI
jgi:type VI protein secretion system component Hcp